MGPERNTHIVALPGKREAALCLKELASYEPGPSRAVLAAELRLPKGPSRETCHAAIDRILGRVAKQPQRKLIMP